MEIPFLALSKQVILAVFFLVFTLTALVVWTSDVNKHADLPLKGDERHHG